MRTVIDPVVRSQDPVTLVGGGQALPEDLHAALRVAPICVAADGGAALAMAAGITPAAVIGDFDSLPAEIEAALSASTLYKVAEQDSTDFEKALIRIDAPLVVGVGFLGGRVDHQLGALHVLLALADRPVLLVAPQELIFLAPPRIELPTKAGDVVSLFPLTSVTAKSEGLRWALDGLGFAPGVQSGTSNVATGPVTVVPSNPGMVMIVPRRLLRPVAAALALPEAARWPARAG